MTTSTNQTWREGWSEGDVLANGIRQHYYRIGADSEKPPLLLLHGFTENGPCWSRVANALAPQYDVIMLDARGHGRSAGPETGYSQALLTQDVVTAITALDLRHPIVFGYSNGAVTAAQVAAAAPELVRAVVVEDPPWSEAPWRPQATQAGAGEPWPGYTAWYNAWVNWHIALRTQTLEERIAASQQFLPPGALDWPGEELATHLEAQAQFNLDVLDHVPPLPVKAPWRATVEQITCPILLLTAGGDRMPSVSPQEVERINATWRHGQHVAFPDATHFLHHELQGAQFERFISVLNTFLRAARESEPV